MSAFGRKIQESGGGCFLFFLLNCITASLFICHYIIWKQKKKKLNCRTLSAACIIVLYSYIFHRCYWAQHPAARFVRLISLKYCSPREAMERIDLGGQQDGPVHPASAQSSGGTQPWFSGAADVTQILSNSNDYPIFVFPLIFLISRLSFFPLKGAGKSQSFSESFTPVDNLIVLHEC